MRLAAWDAIRAGLAADPDFTFDPTIRTEQAGAVPLRPARPPMTLSGAA
ncbi:hypothetical protein [Kitasatospora sp. NPDC057541]